MNKEQVKSDPFCRHGLICIGGMAVFAWSFAIFAPRQMTNGAEAVFFAGIVAVLAYHLFLFRLAAQCKGLSPSEVQSLRRSILLFGPAGVVDFLWRVQRAANKAGYP